MSSPINNNSQPIPVFTPQGPGPGGFTPLEKLLIDTFAPSIGSVLPTAPVDASNPQISAAEFFSSVSAAQLKQKLQEFINSIGDPLLRQKLLEEVGNRAASIADLIDIIVQYRELLSSLNQLDLPGKQKRLNDAVDAYNTNDGQDTTQVNTMNAAISSYTTAQNTYQNALSTYQTSLSTFTAAQNIYNGALATWDQKLNDFNNGLITQPQLEAARGTFNSAQSTFNNAKTVMTNATNTFNTAKTAWQTAQTNLTNAANNYNSYVEDRDGDLSEAISDYNSTIQQAAPIVSGMQQIQAFLFGSNGLQTPSSFSGGTGLETFSLGTPGPDTLRNQVQGILDGSNGAASNINILIGQVTTITTTINNGGYTPVLVAPPILIPISDLPIEQSNYSLDPVQIHPPVKDTFDFKALSELDTDFLNTMLNAVNEYNTTSDKEDNFQRQFTDQLTTFVSALPDQSTGVGSSVSVTANGAAIGGRSNPHLLGALSKHVIETILNVYGVPAGSPLVDQLGALVYGYKDVIGLLSIVPAQKILGNNEIQGPEGLQAVNAAVALGTLSQIQDLIAGGQITDAITKIVNNDPTLAALTPEAKTALIQSLVQEVGVSLIKSSLNQLATSINLPGLVSQILANIFQAGGQPTDLKQIVYEVILSQELAKQLNISRSDAEAIVRDAFSALAQKNQALTQDAITQVIIDQIRADRAASTNAQQNAVSQDAEQEQISEDAALQSDIKQSVIKADAASSARIQEEIDRRDQAKRDAFISSLGSELDARFADPAKIKTLLDIYKPTVLNALIGGLIKPNFLEALTNHLIKLPMSPEEASSVIQTSITKANSMDATLNPLSTFIGNQVLGLNNLSALFKSQVAHILSPVTGQAKALEVAEDYGRLVFADPNSATKLLERTEKSLSTQAGYNFDARVFEDTRNAAQVFINPAEAEGNPLHEANVLLLSGQAAGLSVQGTTSADKAPGSTNQSNRPIEYPG